MGIFQWIYPFVIDRVSFHYLRKENSFSIVYEQIVNTITNVIYITLLLKTGI